MGNRACTPKKTDSSIKLPVLYEVPAIFTIKEIPTIMFGGKKDVVKSSDEESVPRAPKGLPDPQVDPDAEQEEEIIDTESDNIIIEDDEMNELFEEDLELDEVNMVQDGKIDSTPRINSDKAKTSKQVDNHEKNIKSNDEEKYDRYEEYGGDSAMSSISPYGHGKILPESSSALLPLYNDSN